MAGPAKPNRWLIFAAAVVLVATAAIHARGYTSVSSIMIASGAKPALVAAVRALWLMFSAHLIVLGIIVTLASGVTGGRPIVLACALIPAADTVLLFRFLGLFVGTFALAAVTILVVLGGLLQPRHERSRAGT